MDSEFAYDFAKIAGFRNLLAHDYETVEGQLICSALLAGLDEVENYIAQIQRAQK